MGRNSKKQQITQVAVSQKKAATGQPNTPQPMGMRSSGEVIHAFRSSALKRNFEMAGIPTVLNAAGDSNEIELSPQGLLEYVELRIQATVTVTLNSGTLHLSNRGPWNILNHIFLADPDNWPCVINLDGDELNAMEQTKWKRYPHDPAYPYGPTWGYSAGVDAAPVAAGANAWAFSIVVPACVNAEAGDFRGMLNLASANARARIQYIVNSSLLGATDDSLVVQDTGTSTVALTALTVTPVMHFRQPVTVTDGQTGEVWKPTPVAELETVHELSGARNSSLGAGADNPMVFPTGREYLRVLERLVVNGAQVIGAVNGAGDTGATRVKFLVNDTTPITDYALGDYLRLIRREYGRDFNFFIWDLAYRIWDSDSYGDLVTDLFIDSSASISSNSYIQQIRDCVYRAGSVQPLAQYA